MAEVSRGAWAKRLVNHRDLEATRHRLVAIVAWESAENTAAKYNPLATTWDTKGDGDTLFNSVGVRNYPNLITGIRATWKTLEAGADQWGYDAIIRGLQENAEAKVILEALAASAWGTGALALTLLPYVKANYENYANRPIGQ